MTRFPKVRERRVFLFVRDFLRKIVKRVFLLALLSDQKRGKWHTIKSVVLYPPQSHTTTRANIAHEKTEQIRARIVCTPAFKRVAGINTYAEHVCWRRRDGAS